MYTMYDEDEDECEPFDPTIVGCRVQVAEDDDSVINGTVLSVVPAKLDREQDHHKFYQLSDEQQDNMTVHVNVKWDDGTETLVSVQGLYQEDSKLEREFRNAFVKGKKLIDAKLAKASKALQEAEDLAEKYGIPFRAHISPLSQSFYPASHEEKFSDLDREFVTELTGAWSEYSGAGWEHSAVC
jgi:hypothetical protein